MKSKKKLIVNTVNDSYCGLMKDGDSILDDDSKICRLFKDHKGEHVWSFLYV